MSSRLLKGLRVLDLSRMLSGPYCTMHLADHGAEVIKIESADGDTSRGNGPYRADDPHHDWAGYFVSLNRGKKSVQLDLKTEEGVAAFRKLALTADVIVENFRPGVMDRLGLSYETLAQDNTALIYAAIRGFGDPRTGGSPYADWPSYDVVAQAMGGLMAMTGPDADTPTKTGPGVGDIFAGMMMSFAIMAALREAEATGKGCFVDVAMYDAMISLCERMVYLHDFSGAVPGPEGNGHPFLAPFGLFPASDGDVALGIVDDAFWRRLATIMGQPELGQDPRFASRSARAKHRAAILTIVSQWTARHSKAELVGLLGGQVPFGPLNTIADIAADPHVAARKMLAQVPHPVAGQASWQVAANPIRLGGRDPVALTSPPALGADNGLLAHADAPAMTDDEKRALRNAFGSFPTGVTVVATKQADGTPRGFTANSFTSVSLDPPLLLVCIGKHAHSCDTFAACDRFSVNILSDDQKDVSGLFASRAADKFEQADWHSDAQDVPIIDGALTSFSCTKHKLVDAGDHLILIGRVDNFEARKGVPLGYHAGSYFDMGLEQDVVQVAATAGMSVGAVLLNGGRVLLARAPDGSVHVPTAPKGQATLEGLTAFLGANGLNAAIAHLYALYDTSGTGTSRMVYHGTVEGTPSDGMFFADLADLPLDLIADEAERSMLRRYARENRHGAFGLYHGNESEGVVYRLDGHERYTI